MCVDIPCGLGTFNHRTVPWHIHSVGPTELDSLGLGRVPLQLPRIDCEEANSVVAAIIRNKIRTQTRRRLCLVPKGSCHQVSLTRHLETTEISCLKVLSEIKMLACLVHPESCKELIPHLPASFWWVAGHLRHITSSCFIISLCVFMLSFLSACLSCTQFSLSILDKVSF